MSDDGWFERNYNMNDNDEPLHANLFLDSESRMWRLELQGPASMLLFFLLDHGENGIVQKLWEEAKFDRLMKYDLGELDVE
jgi:hypothetical protein